MLRFIPKLSFHCHRWKGENVSTQEVEATISSVLSQEDATVYGVLVPNTDGRAGMVAIPFPSGQEDAEEEMLLRLRDGIRDKLPAYARPVFVRLVRGELELTGKSRRHRCYYY